MRLTINKLRHNTKPASAQRRLERQRGSLLILCVTVLVIIALVGLAFLQQVRIDQAATARHERDYMDMVINGILTDISGKLTDDVFDNIGGDELYDYPWTKDVQNVNATREFPFQQEITVNGAGTSTGPGTYDPSHEDDRWLASTVPVFNANNSNTNKYHWMHLTNLTGIWLDLENGTEDPIDGPITNLVNSDTDTPIGYLEDVTGRTEPLGVDSDLDGIVDSRWQWVPLSVRDFGGRKFIMAVRIVDLNSMVNVNTATIGTAIGNDPLRMRGYSPSGVDISRLAERVDYNDNRLMDNSGIPGDWMRELKAIIATRSLQSSSAPLLPPGYSTPMTASENMRLWEDQASIYGNIDRNYLADSEMDLRRLGGINDFSIESPLEFDLPKLLRQAPNFEQIRGVEASYSDLVDPQGLLVNKPNALISRWFYGTDPSDANEPDTNSVPVKNREFPAIRHMLTTASGTGAYATKYGGAAAGGGRLMFDVSDQWDDDLPGIPTEFTERLAQVFKLPNPGIANGNKYLGLTEAELDDLIEEYILAIQDYSDPDNIPTLRNGFYGMERLPFLREVYFQALYEQAREDINGVAPWEPLYDSLNLGPNYAGWYYNEAGVGGDTRAMIIELGNPFGHQINGIDTFDTVSGQVETNGLDGRVRIVVSQGALPPQTWTFGDASSVTLTPDIDARDDANPGDTLMILSPPVDEISETGGTHDGSKLLADVGVTNGVKWLKVQPGTLTDGLVPGDGAILVELQVRASDGNWVTYDQIETVDETGLPTEEDDSTPVAGPPNHQFAQASFARDSDKIKYIVDDGPTGSYYSGTTSPLDGAYSTSVNNLGRDNKGSATVATYPAPYNQFFERLQLPLADQPMRSTAEMAWVHMFGFTSGQAFSERMSAIQAPVWQGLPANQHFLLLDPADPDFKVLPSPPTGAGIPHAAVLMNVFTTVSPRKDGQDNDNEDGDDDINTGIDESPPTNPGDPNEEQFIPGTINVNTAPLHVLTLGSPLAESIDDTEKLMRTIVSYRDQPIRAAAGHPDDPETPFRDDASGGNIRQITSTGALAPLDRPFKPGIGSVGELLFMNPYVPAASNALKKFNMHRYGQDTGAGSQILPNGVDLYPDPDESTASTVDQGNDNEQLMARFQMLGQTFTVRSDRFVVYAVVRGYDGIIPSSPAFNDLAESAQFIAVFDRGSMKDANDSPRVIGFVRLQ